MKIDRECCCLIYAKKEKIFIQDQNQSLLLRYSIHYRLIFVDKQCTFKRSCHAQRDYYHPIPAVLCNLFWMCNNCK